MSADLTTTYLGLTLECPLIASSSPLTGKLETLRAIVDHGAGAVVLPSLFEEEVTDGAGASSEALWHAEGQAGEAKAYMATVDHGHLDSYLDLVREARRELDVPVVASLNGTTAGGWTRTAELLQEAGADAIELNVYSVETDPYASGASIEERTLRLVHAVRHAVTVPVAVKLSPYYTAFANVAHRLAEARADGLVLFNRFVQPDVDVSAIEVSPSLELSRPDELRIALRWLAILRGRIDVSLAATGGVHTSQDAVKAILAGADAVMMTSALLQEGIGRMRDVRHGLADWLNANGLTLGEARGRLSQVACGNPRAYERAQYVETIGAANAMR
ncbi:MAG TPA: dihydroorotate dehydrogenase-like protein [Gaiella sp.]|uniref:dihydroorotate dehydrogenase-like protein n=1 Tax=Gaiella sp. TaxID=2663207 RepID=UPI002D7F07C2|nr:dihydroorotate dehydrogenase-like protein [Gaiella sp.]HET9286340.1 dihydroorotate dehydrogenase-like protein [Gaiella sp.]